MMNEVVEDSPPTRVQLDDIVIFFIISLMKSEKAAKAAARFQCKNNCIGKNCVTMGLELEKCKWVRRALHDNIAAHTKFIQSATDPLVHVNLYIFCSCIELTVYRTRRYSKQE